MMSAHMTAWADVLSSIECDEVRRTSGGNAFVVVNVNAKTVNFDVVASLSVHLGDEATATRLASAFTEAAAKLRAAAERELGIAAEVKS